MESSMMTYSHIATFRRFRAYMHKSRIESSKHISAFCVIGDTSCLALKTIHIHTYTHTHTHRQRHMEVIDTNIFRKHSLITGGDTPLRMLISLPYVEGTNRHQCTLLLPWKADVGDIGVETRDD